MTTWESAADRLSILTACGGVTAVVEGDSITAVFDHGYAEVQGIESEAPLLMCRTSDVASVAHGDAVTVNSTSYAVRGIQNDGTGVTILVLEEQ